jgi:hypothetical protein
LVCEFVYGYRAARIAIPRAAQMPRGFIYLTRGSGPRVPYRRRSGHGQDAIAAYTNKKDAPRRKPKSSSCKARKAPTSIRIAAKSHHNDSHHDRRTPALNILKPPDIIS